MEHSFIIEKNIPMPKVAATTRKYPWLEMAIDESFVVPLTSRAKVAASMTQANKRYGVRRFIGITRIENNERVYRVWRSA